jgi:UDP-N-acetylmuramoyl-L-alanyl-D-glutamate--2,6-diaminopimelate ligase
MTGVFNVDNALLAAAVATGLGVDEQAVVDGLHRAEAPAGRMEVVTAGPPFAVLVDYAHTPAGLGVALASARRLAGDGRVVCVFGCGGDRDAEKRPLMGEVAGRLADVTVLTSDNPRSEDPQAIIDQVRAGVPADAGLVVEPDRREAVHRAVSLARPGDVVVVAGKGHETTQVIGDVVLPFDDRDVVREALAAGGLGEGG